MDFKTNHTESLNSCIPNSSKAVQNFSLPGDASRMSYGSFIMPTMFGIICLLAITGNSFVICTVLKKSGPSSSIPDIIISFSMVDLLFLLGMPFLIHQLLGNRAWHSGETMCTIITALDANSQFTSIYILTAMSINLATDHPFTSTPFRKPPLTILVICILWAFPFPNITHMWMYTQLLPLPGGLQGCGIHLPDPQRDFYWYTLYQLFLVFASPFVLITVAYRRILLKMSSYSEVLMSQRCTRVSAICVAFSSSWAPFRILQLAQPTMTSPTPPVYYTYNVTISLSYADSCLNALIYILLGQNFERQLGVPVRPAGAGQASPKGRQSIGEDALEPWQPLLHLVASSGR